MTEEAYVAIELELLATQAISGQYNSSQQISLAIAEKDFNKVAKQLYEAYFNLAHTRMQFSGITFDVLLQNRDFAESTIVPNFEREVDGHRVLVPFFGLIRAAVKAAVHADPFIPFDESAHGSSRDTVVAAELQQIEQALRAHYSVAASGHSTL